MIGYWRIILLSVRLSVTLYIWLWNTLVQLLALYTNPESQNAQATDRGMTGLRQIADHTV